MPSCAQQVVNAAAARLVAAATAAGDRVYTDRLWPTDAANTPDLLVLAGKERIKPVTVHWPRVNEHRLELLVAGRARAVTGMDAALDALLMQCLGAFFDTVEHASLGLLPQPLAQLEIDRRKPDPAELQALGKSEFATGQVLLVLEAVFHATDTAPDTFA